MVKLPTAPCSDLPSQSIIKHEVLVKLCVTVSLSEVCSNRVVHISVFFRQTSWLTSYYVHFPHLEEEKEKVEKFLYLESILAVEGSKEEGVQTRIPGKQKPSHYRPRLRYSTPMLKLYCYGSKTCRTTTNFFNKLQSFIKLITSTCGKKPNMKTIEVQLLRGKWIWAGHTLRRDKTAITKQGLTWNHVLKRNTKA